MKYILNKRFRLRGWYKLPCGLYDTIERNAVFFDPGLYQHLLHCDAEYDFDREALTEKERHSLDQFLKEEIIRPAGLLDYLLPEQRYHAYPARYRKSVHWSVTGECNLRCLHCFMSAPHAKHGNPSHDEIMDMIDQFAECGVFTADLTGGEPLIRKDFEDIIKALAAREIAVGSLITNGWLVNEKLLDLLERYGMHPSFQISFDGIGWHDFLRGVPGAEERTVEAFRLLQKRGYHVSSSMCLHKKNAHTLRDSVKFLASLGVNSLKCGPMMQQGEWANPAMEENYLSFEEGMALFERYIPQYFEDDAPLDIMMSGAFIFRKGSRKGWDCYYHRECSAEEEDEKQSCMSLVHTFYVGADGMVAPCQGMCDSGFAKNFPNLKEHRLSWILSESDYVKYSYATVGDVRRGNEECRTCGFVDRCAGSCRNHALLAGDNYYGVDPEACLFFKNGWEERLNAAAKPAYEAYLKRNPGTEADFLQ